MSLLGFEKQLKIVVVVAVGLCVNLEGFPHFHSFIFKPRQVFFLFFGAVSA